MDFNRKTEYVNAAVRDHQLDEATTWVHHPRLHRFHDFFHIFNRELFQAQPLPLPVISIEPSRRTRLGHYVPGRDGFGICHHINVNRRWLNTPGADDDNPSRLTTLEELVVLSHEMVHEWQELYGVPSKTGWYHNKEWLQMSAGIGIISAKPRGHTVKITDPFLSVCRANGITDPVPTFNAKMIDAKAPDAMLTGQSTLTKWTCRCNPPVNLRVGRTQIRVRCEVCGARFEQA